MEDAPEEGTQHAARDHAVIYHIIINYLLLISATPNILGSLQIKIITM